MNKITPYETTLNDSILILRSLHNNRGQVDAFWQHVAAYVEQQRARQQPIFYLHYSARIGLTQYSRQISDERLFNLRHIHGYGAYVFGKDLISYVVKSYVMSIVKRNLVNVEIKEFPTEDEALAWLEDRYQAYLAASAF